MLRDAELWQPLFPGRRHDPATRKPRRLWDARSGCPEQRRNAWLPRLRLPRLWLPELRHAGLWRRGDESGPGVRRHAPDGLRWLSGPGPDAGLRDAPGLRRAD